MLRTTRQNYGIRAWQKCFGGARVFQSEPPYYLKQSPGNPWFGMVHDGTSTAWGEGFTHKPMNWIYRFRWNSQHRGAQTLFTRNPGGKCPHWLEISYYAKMKPHLFNYEVLPHTIMLMIVSAIVIWNLSRYVLFHPDLTIYNVIYFSMRRYVNVLRNQEIPNLDTPTFRWFQAAPEFYGYNPHREMIEMGVLANDPYLEYMKAIGKEKTLLKKPGEAGFNTSTQYLPNYQWGYSYKDSQGDKNPIPTPSA